ncbi:MAG: S8 family serine peptidase [Dehalococcoidales bacterium]|nr:S8 family serine peptidase [Dehalococcoidales bacterium]
MKILRIIIPGIVIIAFLTVMVRVSADNAMAAYAAVPIPVMPAQNAAAASVDVAEVELEGNAVIAPVEPFVPNDPYLDRQWALTHIQIGELWRTTTSGAGILVAVLDTGIDKGHEDLIGKVVAEVNFTDSPVAGDLYGHGTHIAGIIAAYSDNGLGVVGVAPQSLLLNVKVAEDDGRCETSVVARGIIWAVDNGAVVINVSIEIREPSAELEEAVNYAWEHGAIVIAAAGNEGSQTPVYPAYYEHCIAVAAIEPDDTLALLSNYGGWVDMAAPGFDIYSTLPGNEYGYKTGTSFATAYVSGLAAILFDTLADANGDGYLNDEVRAALENGCQQVIGFEVGYGRIDAASIAGSCYLP